VKYKFDRKVSLIPCPISKLMDRAFADAVDWIVEIFAAFLFLSFLIPLAFPFSFFLFLVLPNFLYSFYKF